MYLSWTDDVPIVYPPYTCATGNVQDECLTPMGFMSAARDRHAGRPATSQVKGHDTVLAPHRQLQPAPAPSVPPATAAGRGRPSQRSPGLACSAAEGARWRDQWVLPGSV